MAPKKNAKNVNEKEKDVIEKEEEKKNLPTAAQELAEIKKETKPMDIKEMVKLADNKPVISKFVRTALTLCFLPILVMLFVMFGYADPLVGLFITDLNKWRPTLAGAIAVICVQGILIYYVVTAVREPDERLDTNGNLIKGTAKKKE